MKYRDWLYEWLENFVKPAIFLHNVAVCRPRPACPWCARRSEGATTEFCK